MAECLIALGSNLGDRGAILRDAVSALACLPRTYLVACSRWHETAPVGGPAGQGPFLNGAALLSTALTSGELYSEIVQIEAQLGRVRAARWAARTLDLDLLLLGGEVSDAGPGGLVVPHPRMHSRRFVLAPGADVAPWMVHPPSGWTVAQLLRQLEAGDPGAAIAGSDRELVAELADRLSAKLRQSRAPLDVRVWNGGTWNPGPRVLLAVDGVTGADTIARRKILNLPATGPVTWLSSGTPDDLAAEASTVLASACPTLASS